MPLKTVKVPNSMNAAFAKAEDVVSGYFAGAVFDPAKGMIEICNERYVLVRAASLSFEFFSLVRDLFGKERKADADAFARNILYDLAHAVGRADARDFHLKMKLKDPIGRLSAGPIHFAHSGWAFVDILPESNAVPGKDFCLVYDHPYSFEADAWLDAGRKADFPVCIMNAGYSSGWCAESFKEPLSAVEVECRARGDARCRFVMAPPELIESRIAGREGGRAGREANHYEIPDFFSRKRAEEKLKKSEELYRTLAESAQDYIFVVGREGIFRYVNGYAASRLGSSQDAMAGRHMESFFSASAFDSFWGRVKQVLESGSALEVDERMELPGRSVWLDMLLLPLREGSDSVAAVLCIARDVTARRESGERLAKLNACFAGFGVNPLDNIKRLVAVCGDLLGATCALYNRLEGGMLCSIGQWETPADLGARNDPEGHICYDVILNGEEKLFVVRDLLKSPYAKTDPNVIIHNLETYVGRAVFCSGRAIGSLCCVFQRNFVPSDADAGLMGIVAAVIGNEEARRKAETELRNEADRLSAKLELVAEGRD